MRKQRRRAALSLNSFSNALQASAARGAPRHPPTDLGSDHLRNYDAN